MTDRARLVHRDAHARDLELLEHDAGDLAGERFDQAITASFDEREHALRDGLVIERVFDGITARRRAQVFPDLEVDFETPLPEESAVLAPVFSSSFQ